MLETSSIEGEALHYIKVNESISARRRIFFHLVDAADGITPELGEAGGQPQISTNGAAFTSTGIGALTSIGFGRYYADLTEAAVANIGDSIETRYKSANTAESPGDSVKVVAWDPFYGVGDNSSTVVVGSDDDCGDVQFFDAGEKRPVMGRLAVTSGTFTVSGARVYLNDADGDAVYGIDNLVATGFDAGALTAPRVWYNLDTASPPSSGPIVAGAYDLVFVVSGTSSDGIPRVIEIHITIQVA